MFKRSLTDAPRCTRGGLTSHILLQRGDLDGAKLAVTWVDIEPGASHGPHAHMPEQIYVAVRGQGCMHIDGETQSLATGDFVYIPSGAEHYAENTGETVFSYVSAATPSFDITSRFNQDALGVS